MDGWMDGRMVAEASEAYTCIGVRCYDYYDICIYICIIINGTESHPASQYII